MMHLAGHRRLQSDYRVKEKKGSTEELGGTELRGEKKGFGREKGVLEGKKGSTEELGGTEIHGEKGFHEKFGGTGGTQNKLKLCASPYLRAPPWNPFFLSLA